MRIALCILICLTTGRAARAQHFDIVTVQDSLSLLTLSSAEQTDTLELPYQVYRFCTSDLNGDGKEEALVGVVKPTRFFAQADRRLFILKNYDGHIRTLWRGSRIGRRLIDFRAKGMKIRCLMQMSGERYAVGDFSLARFGLRFEKFIIEDASEEEGRRAFEEQDEDF